MIILYAKKKRIYKTYEYSKYDPIGFLKCIYHLLFSREVIIVKEK